MYSACHGSYGLCIEWHAYWSVYLMCLSTCQQEIAFTFEVNSGVSVQVHLAHLQGLCKVSFDLLTIVWGQHLHLMQQYL